MSLNCLAGALEGRLLDFDDNVRIQAMTIVCDLAMSDLNSFPSELVLQAYERLRDKKVTSLYSDFKILFILLNFIISQRYFFPGNC